MASDVSTTDSDVRVFALEEKSVDSGPDIEISCGVPLGQDEVAILGTSDYSTTVASWLLFLGMNVRMYNPDSYNAKLVRRIQNEVVTCHELFGAIQSRLDVQGPHFESGAYEQGKLLVSQLLEEVMHPNVVAIMDCMARDNALLYHQCRAYVPSVVVLISADVPPAVQLDFMYMVRFIEPVRFIRPVVVEPNTPKSVLTLLRRLMLFPTPNAPPINISEAQENCFKAIGRRPLRHVWAPHCMECHGAKTLVMNQNCVHVWLCKDCCAFRTDPCPTCGAAFSPFLWRQTLDGETAYEVSVCGAGYLGMKITAWLLWLGVDVWVHDIYKPREDIARELQHELENIDTIFYELGMKCGQVAGDLNNRYLRPMGRFLGASSALEDCLGVRTFLVIDAVIDDVLVKGDFFHRCQQLSPQAILTTNSMQLSLENISQQAQLKENKVFRLRFLEPVYFIPFVETSQEDPRVDDPQLKSLLGFLDWCNSMPFSGSYRLKLFPSVVDSIQLIQLSALMQRKPMKNMFMRTETCIVCWSRPPVVLNIGGCTHICLCRDCAPRMVAKSLVDSQCRAQVCPLCRAPLRPVAETPLLAV